MPDARKARRSGFVVAAQSAPNISLLSVILPLSMSRTLTIGYPTIALALARQASTIISRVI
jgi:hypothetical protein